MEPPRPCCWAGHLLVNKVTTGWTPAALSPDGYSSVASLSPGEELQLTDRSFKMISRGTKR